MERLEPLLKQKFWILLGVGMIMTIVGWWVSTSSMASTIGVRTKEINEAVTKVPGGEIPNVSWASKLSAINARQDLSINVTQLDLWKRQHAKMRLPDGVDAQAQYQAKLSNESRELFRDGYPHEVRRVWKAVSPMDVDGTGIVQYPLLAFGKALGKGPWPNQPPPNQDIWDVMEDLWLAESLFQSIAAVNGAHDAGRTDACIHQIDRFEFRGGVKERGVASDAAVDPRFVVLVIFACEREFGIFCSRDFIGNWRETGAPLVIGEYDARNGRGSQRFAIG